LGAANPWWCPHQVPIGASNRARVLESWAWGFWKALGATAALPSRPAEPFLRQEP
jgi:hypothetical protein